jgi:hypothetical protein
LTSFGRRRDNAILFMTGALDVNETRSTLVLAGLCVLAVAGCGERSAPGTSAPKHPLVGHWAVVSSNGKPLPPGARVTIEFRECECMLVDPHGNAELGRRFDATRLRALFRAYRGAAPGVGEEVALADGAFQVVVRRIDAGAPPCCQGPVDSQQAKTAP